MPKFPESTRFAVVGDSTELFARAPLRIGSGKNDINSEDLAAYLADLEKSFGKHFNKNLILVSGNNPAILEQDGTLSPYSTLLDNHDKLVEGIKDWHKVMQLGPVTPEGGKFKAKAYGNGHCLFDVGHAELSGEERFKPLSARMAFDAAHILEAVEELGLGETPESKRGLLARFNGLLDVGARFDFAESKEKRGRHLTIDGVPVAAVEYDDKNEPNVYLLHNDKSLEVLGKAYARVPATLTIGLNRNFGPVTFVANYVPVTTLEDAAQTPLSMECESGKHPLVVPVRALGQVGARAKKYDGKEIKNLTACAQTTITTMGMYAGADTPEYWKDLTGKKMPLEIEDRREREKLLFLRRAINETPVTSADQTFALFRTYGGKRLDELCGK